MSTKNNRKSLPLRELHITKEINQGYPFYPGSDDIYMKSKEMRDINPEDTSRVKVPNQPEKQGLSNEQDFKDDLSGNDLDVPGSELDDELEKIGSEDEENNFYSIGGDGHNGLDENNGS
ncbi:MAG: hypothetical protein NTW16_04945 [Bacteroidetes bacterium]|nr:hypothetical protein [Bacteroidota bacterium]